MSEAKDLTTVDGKKLETKSESTETESSDKILTAQFRATSGPLPPAELLKAYEEAQPGAADRIISFAEIEQIHRHYMEKDTVEKAFRRDRYGQNCAVLACLMGFAATCYLAYLGSEVAASIVGTGTIGSLVTAFLTSKN
jgi:uncharacterized membrane protein